MSSEEKGSPGVGTWMAFLLLLVVLYVLSVGPAMGACQWLGIDQSDAFRSAYAPVAWLYDHTPLQGPIGWYVCQCGGMQ